MHAVGRKLDGMSLREARRAVDLVVKAVSGIGPDSVDQRIAGDVVGAGDAAVLMQRQGRRRWRLGIAVEIDGVAGGIGSCRRRRRRSTGSPAPMA